VGIIKITDATECEKKAFILAAEEFEKEINNPKFWEELRMIYPQWLYNNNLNTAAFKRLFLSGRDKFETKDDFHIRINVTFYYSRKSVVGATYPSTWFTWVNRNIFKGFDVADIAGNQAHEYLHNLAFSHPGANKQSVPYQFGYLIRDRIKKRLKLSPETKVKVKRSFWSRIKRIFKG